MLVPLSEYIPFGEIRFLADFVKSRFGIEQFFLPGNKPQVFQGKIPYGLSICYEETYPAFAAETRRKGAELFINVTNDAWFPHSLLPKQHFDHGRLRAVENGVPLLRVCNTGITAGVDRFGRMVESLPPSESKIDVLILDLPTSTHKTLYTFWGDKMILGLSFLFLLFPAIERKKKTLL